MGFSAVRVLLSHFKSLLLYAMVVLVGTSQLRSLAWASVEGSISGHVSAPGLSPEAQLTVSLKTAEGQVVSELSVKPSEDYRLFPVLVGDYQLRVCLKLDCSPAVLVHVASGGENQEDLHYEKAQSPAGSVVANPSSEALAPSSQDVVVEVKAKKRLIQNSAVGTQFEVSQTQVRQLPQGSEVSLPKLISSTTAGVIPGSFGQFFVRGNHASVQYQIDGVQMPESPSSTFGQAFSTRNIDRMEVITGGIPAEYGQRLAAVVNIVTKSGPEKPQGEIELNYGSYNTFSPHLLYGGSNESGSFKYYLGLNYAQTDRGIDTPNPISTSLKDQAQGGTDSSHNQSTSNNEFAKFDWQLDSSNKLSLILFNAYSFYQLPNYPSSFSSSDPYFSDHYTDAFGNDTEGHPIYGYTPSTTNDTQAERNAYAQIVWRRTLDSRSYWQLAPYYKYSSIVNTNDPTNDMYAFGRITNANPNAFAQDRSTNSVGLKADYSNRFMDNHLLKTGFQVQTSQVAGSYAVQFVNTANNQTQTVSNSDPMSGTFESLYVQDDITLHKGLDRIEHNLVLNAGMRFDATQFNYSGTNPTDYQFQPRIGLSYMPEESTRYHLFYGRLFQPAPIENLRSTFVATDANAALNPYDIKAEKADYYEVGVSHQVFNRHVLGVNLFYKVGVNFLDEGQLLRTPIAQPFNFANGYAYGAELSLKGEINADWSDYLNYSYLIAQAKGISGGMWANDHGSSSVYQNMDHAQTHTANAGLTYSKKGFWWTTQALFGSGLWTGETNDIELPYHLTFDTTVGYNWVDREGEQTRWRLSLDALNFLDNRYPITIANSFNGSHYAAGRQFFVRLAKSF
jgi:hypothetical protein